ncbi:hypothetical protein BX616_009295 [Lobosporangium transversale]|uniref:Transferase family-domain-containing protein n=1 Tax=Lobosporangium transversale TaxID=64571 RepID=A0A1Y2GYH0_9FUNG|nr:transferase family-domain-containing protein [Lobosporangium transversale]KAF9913928.1 hypothetical protein BX616_009295 [Lobosporangium transversale]ORZ23813.1 transferase family-domain-containing protein [Lobosporangium transversale]|eukprot:XP_021883627.1 transferase family-domain-containing protein [Lobosporangium transversale]
MTLEHMRQEAEKNGTRSLDSASSPSTVGTATFMTSRSPSSSSLHSTRPTSVTRLRYRQLVQPITPTEPELVNTEGEAKIGEHASDDANVSPVTMQYPRVQLSSLDLAKPRIYTRLLYFFDINKQSDLLPSASSFALGREEGIASGLSSPPSPQIFSSPVGSQKKGDFKGRHHYHYHQSPFMDPMLLQASLALVLNDFFPLAGRLYNNSNDQPSISTSSAASVNNNKSTSKGQYIECNDRGVLFAVADTTVTMMQIRQGGYQDTVLPPQLFPVGLYPASLRDPPLLGIQLTYTSDHSLIMGVAMDSSIMDATSLVSFMDAWSNITQGKDFSPYPILDRAFLEKYGEEHTGSGGVYRHQRINNSPPPPILFDNNLGNSDLIDKGLGDSDLHSEDDDDNADEDDEEHDRDIEQYNDLTDESKGGMPRDPAALERVQQRMQSLHLHPSNGTLGIPTFKIDHAENQEPHLQQQQPKVPIEDISEAASTDREGSSFRLFHFSPEQLERIKKLASEQNIAAAACAADDKEINDKWVSTGDSLIAYLWKMSTIARRMEPDCKLMCGVVMDIRNRVVPAIPEGFIGNAILSIFVQMPVHSLLTTPLSLPSRLLRDELLLQTPEQIQSAINWIQKQDNPQLIETDSNNPFGHDFMVWSFRKLDMYSPDFGQGRPCKVRIGRGGFGGGEGMCVIMGSEPSTAMGRDMGSSQSQAISETGVDVYLGLQDEHLQDFEKIHRGFMEGLLEPDGGSSGNGWEVVY